MKNTDIRVGPCSLGRGLFATRSYQPDDLILVFKGTAFNREDPIHDTDKGVNLLQTGRRTYILLREPGVFANHSCDPNAGIRENRRLVAIAPIEPGDEIRFDYSTTMDEDFWTMPCRCDSPACRGKVEDFRFLPLHVRRRYLELGIVQGFIARRYQ